MHFVVWFSFENVHYSQSLTHGCTLGSFPTPGVRNSAVIHANMSLGSLLFLTFILSWYTLFLNINDNSRIFILVTTKNSPFAHGWGRFRPQSILMDLWSNITLFMNDNDWDIFILVEMFDTFCFTLFLIL